MGWPTQELVVPSVFINMELHPGHTVLAQQATVAATAVSAGVLAIFNFEVGLCSCGGDAVIKR